MTKKYYILTLFERLRNLLYDFVPSDILINGKLTDQVLGTLIGKSKNHINYIKSQVKKDPEFKVSLETIEIYKESLIEALQRIS